MSIKTWEKRCDAYDKGEPITNSLLNKLKSIFNQPIFLEGKPERMLLEERALYEYGDGPGWTITPEQTKKGLDWMAQPRILKKFSAVCMPHYSMTREVDLRPIIENFSHFTFEGIHPDMVGMRYTGELIYRVHAKDGSFFDYSASPWQQGGRTPFIVYREHIEKAEVQS